MRRALLVMTIAAMSAVGFAADEPEEHDVVVYGATSAGVVTAVAAAREGASAVLLEPGNHVGGMSSGGLGRTDHGRKEVVGGYSLEFYKRVGKHYNEEVGWYFEPHVAEKVFKEMLAETSVSVHMSSRLKEQGGVVKEDGAIREIVMENGKVYRGKVFVDCSYEGDLMARAGVSYTWGREGVEQYGESLAGVREKTPFHQFKVNVPGRGKDGKLLPGIQSEDKGKVGSDDKKVQAYNYRLCMTKVKENQVPFPKPKNYDPGRFELLLRLIEEHEKTTGPLTVATLMHPAILKNQKTDTNNNGAFSTDHIGGNWNYPDATYAEREKIVQDHKDYVGGFLYFLANDDRVPARLRDEMNTWGLAKDEFQDTGHWPHQLYVREARRMVGEYVMAQPDIQTSRTKSDVIGMGSYNSDSHNVQRFLNADGFAENEGDVQVGVKPYQIPYRCLLPKRAEATNLIVPVCLSATHVAYSTLRMEPVYMIVGQAAGVAAKMAIDAGKPVHDIDTAALSAKLLAQKAVMEWVPPARPAPKAKAEPVKK